MKNDLVVIAILAIAIACWLVLWILPADFEPGSEHSRYVVLINNDPSERHWENMKTAIDALKSYDFLKIIALGDRSKIPTLAQVRQALQAIQEKGGKLELLYITGHGTRLFNQEHPEGFPAVMLKDQPLTPLHLAPVIGKGPTVMYFDQCFAPSFIECLQEQLQDTFLLLSDKHEEHPTASCRGISTELWKELRLNAKKETMFQAVFHAWEKHCKDGIYRIVEVSQESDYWKRLLDLETRENEDTPYPG